NGGVWNVLGTFEFAADGSGHVKLTNAADQYVIADAVKFERIPEAAGGSEVLLEDAFNTTGPGDNVNFEVSSRQSGSIAPVRWLADAGNSGSQVRIAASTEEGGGALL